MVYSIEIQQLILNSDSCMAHGPFVFNLQGINQHANTLCGMWCNKLT